MFIYLDGRNIGISLHRVVFLQTLFLVLIALYLSIWCLIRTRRLDMASTEFLCCSINGKKKVGHGKFYQWSTLLWYWGLSSWVMVSNWQLFHPRWLWDLFLACSCPCVTARASMSAIKCDLKWAWPPAFTVGRWAVFDTLNTLLAVIIKISGLLHVNMLIVGLENIKFVGISFVGYIVQHQQCLDEGTWDPLKIQCLLNWPVGSCEVNTGC